MRVLLVTNSLQGGGAERVMAVVASYLARRHTVRLLSIYGEEAEYEVSDDVEVLFSAGQHYNWTSLVDWIADHIDDFKPDVTMSFLHGVNDMTITARYRAHHDAPVVISERVDPTWATHIEHLVGRERLYPLADGGIFQTPEIEEYYRVNHAMRNTTTLVNPLSPGFELEPFDGEREKRIVAVGRLAPEKNHALLIRAFEHVADEFPEHTLEIYGEGELNGDLRRQIGAAGLEKRVFLRGRVRDVPKHIASASLFVHSSLHEGMPNAVLEAMALGLPCLVTDTPYGGTAALVDPGINALMVPMDDEYALAEGIRAMLANDELRARISDAAPAIVDKYRAEVVCPKWEEYLERTVRAYGQPADRDELRARAEEGFRALCSFDVKTAIKQKLTRNQFIFLRSCKHAVRDASQTARMVGRAIASRGASASVRPDQSAGPDDSSRLKIAFVIYSMSGGGAERVISVLAQALSERHDVSIIVVNSDRDYEAGPDVDIVCSFSPSDPEFIKRTAAIYRGLEQVRPDVAISFLSGPGCWAIASKLVSGGGYKVIVSERNCPYHKFEDTWRRGATKLAYLFADGGVFQTKDALAYWSRWCRRNAVILPNPLNPAIRERGLRRAQERELPRDRRIVNVGRLVPQKNQAQLIRAFARVAGEFPECTLEIYGEGELREELEALIGALGIEERVVLMGRVPSDEIAQRIENAAVFAFPSLWEGLPNALIEAMALGMPCVASDCTIGGPRDLIENGENGLLVPVDDEEALVEALRSLLADDEYADRLGRTARSSVDRFEAESVCSAWEEYIRAVATGEKQRSSHAWSRP